MSLLSENHPVDLADRLRDTYPVTAEFISDIILQANPAQRAGHADSGEFAL